MKPILLIISFLFTILFANSQMPSIPPEVSAIMKKMKEGADLSEAEEQTMEKWFQNMDKSFGGKIEQQNQPQKKQSSSSGIKVSSGIKLPQTIPALNRGSYIDLARVLMQSYGSKSGDLSGIESLLLNAKTTDGANYGALFMMEGAGAASVYSCAWSAIREPDDILTANNLAIALKNEGEYVKALQVLNYAKNIKPGIGLIISNAGWIYFNAGDMVNAKLEFNAALKAAPEMTSPYLGLGLIAQIEGNNTRAKEYLRKALKDRYSSIGITAYRNAQENQSTENQTVDKPVSNDKATVSFTVPDIPVYDKPEKMGSQESVLQNYLTKVDNRLTQVQHEIDILTQRIIKQQELAMQNPDGALVYKRDFSKEMMMLEDIELLLWGQTSNYGKSLKQSIAEIEKLEPILEQNSKLMLYYAEKGLLIQNKLEPLYERMAKCNGNEACLKQVGKEMEPYFAEQKQLTKMTCELSKQQMDVLFSSNYKSLSLIQSQFVYTVSDYYAFTDPIIKKIYAPSLNELYNLKREARILSKSKELATRALGLAEDALKYNDLECFEPEPPASADSEIADETAPSKKPEKCPLGDGLKAEIGSFSFELTCTHVKVSGGEGILASVKRDFVRQETTLWAGVGAKAEFAHGNLTAEATIGAEITIGQNTVKDVGFASSVKAGLGGLMEAEISGRIALEGGANIDMSTEILP